MLAANTQQGGKHGTKETDHEKDQRDLAIEMSAEAQRPSGGREPEGCSQHGGGEYIKRAQRAGLDWPQVEKMEETELKGKLFPPKEPERCKNYIQSLKIRLELLPFLEKNYLVEVFVPYGLKNLWRG